MSVVNKPLDLPEWQAFRDSFDNLPSPGASGGRTGSDRVMCINFREEKPPREFVEHVFAHIYSRMELVGYPGNRERWNTKDIWAHPERFAEHAESEDEGAHQQNNPHRWESLLAARNVIVGEVALGQRGFQEAYADLLEVISELED